MQPLKRILTQSSDSRVCVQSTPTIGRALPFTYMIDQHGSLLERVSATTKLGPVDAVLVAAAVVATPVPDTVEVGVGTGMVPPASPLVQGAVT